MIRYECDHCGALSKPQPSIVPIPLGWLVARTPSGGWIIGCNGHCAYQASK